MNTLYSISRGLALGALLLGSTLATQAQQVAQYGFRGIRVPQYMGAGNNSSTTTPGPKLAVVFQATVSGMLPNQTYRYYVKGGLMSDLGSTNDGEGDAIFITPTGYVLSTSPSLTSTSTGKYATMRSDANGSYTGWFAFLNDNNAYFTTASNVIYPIITLANDFTPSSEERQMLDVGIKPIAFANTAASNGTLLTGSSSAAPKNVVLLYDNVAGTGRPLSAALVESAGIATGVSKTGTNAYTYSTSNGAYSTIIPNLNPNGVRLVAEVSPLTGAFLHCNTDADGTWPSGANTVNPTGGTRAVVLTATDAPLTAACTTLLASRPASEAQLSVYPNPVRDVLTISFDKPAAGHAVVLRDLLGRVLRQAELPASGQLSLAGLPAGTYLLTVDGTLTRRITKE